MHNFIKFYICSKFCLWRLNLSYIFYRYRNKGYPFQLSCILPKKTSHLNDLTLPPFVCSLVFYLEAAYIVLNDMSFVCWDEKNAYYMYIYWNCNQKKALCFAFWFRKNKDLHFLINAMMYFWSNYSVAEGWWLYPIHYRGTIQTTLAKALCHTKSNVTGKIKNSWHFYNILCGKFVQFLNILHSVLNKLKTFFMI